MVCFFGSSTPKRGQWGGLGESHSQQHSVHQGKMKTLYNEIMTKNIPKHRGQVMFFRPKNKIIFNIKKF